MGDLTYNIGSGLLCGPCAPSPLTHLVVVAAARQESAASRSFRRLKKSPSPRGLTALLPFYLARRFLADEMGVVRETRPGRRPPVAASAT